MSEMFASEGFDRWAVRSVWAVIPLEYYVLTTIAGGFSNRGYVASAAIALLSVLLFAIISGLIGLVYPLGASIYIDRLRSLTAATLLTWCVTLILLSLSFLITWAATGRSMDAVEQIICGTGKYQIGCPGHPGFRWQTFLIYGIYALLATIIVFFVFSILLGWRSRQRQRPKPRGQRLSATPSQVPALPEPGLLGVALIVTIVTALLQASTVFVWNEHPTSEVEGNVLAVGSDRSG